MAVPEWLSQNDRWHGYLDEVLRRESWQEYPVAFYERLAGLSRRARFVAWRIFEDGSVSTRVLQGNGYDHPPRARKDLTDHGIRVLSSRGRDEETGRVMAIYSFAPPEEVLTAEQAGRTALPRDFVRRVAEDADHQCALCSGRFEDRFLQADHRVPYAIAGDALDAPLDPARFMAVGRSCNRAKSWTCEHCPNWPVQDAAVCATCYWAAPEGYEHIATEPARRLDLVWRGDETADFDMLRSLAERMGEPLPGYVRAVLARHLVDSP